MRRWRTPPCMQDGSLEKSLEEFKQQARRVHQVLELVVEGSC